VETTKNLNYQKIREISQVFVCQNHQE